MKVSVVIPVYNAQATIQRALQSLALQKVDFDYEIIVVDSSSDETPQIIGAEFPQAKLIHLEKKTPVGAARNVGIKAARGEVIAFIDSDCVAQDGWLSALIKAHDEVPAAAGVGGSVTNANPESAVGWASFLIEFARVLPSGSRREVGDIVGCNSSYKRWVFERYGLNHGGNFAGDDMLFNWMLTRNGESLLFEPRARIAHINREEFNVFLTHMRHLGRGVGIVRLGYGMPHCFTTRSKFLHALLAPARATRIAYRVFKYAPDSAWRLLYLWPLTLMGFIWFGMGETDAKQALATTGVPALARLDDDSESRQEVQPVL